MRDKTGGRKIIVLCEGRTEVEAVQRFLRKQWLSDGFNPVGLCPIDLRGRLDNIIERVPLHLRLQDVLGVFTLLDLCRYNRKGIPLTEDKPVRIAKSKAWLCDQILPEYRSRFHPHFAVYETETWIIADGLALAQRLRDANIKPHPCAEELNDQDTPKSRLGKLFKAHGRNDGYLQVRDGSLLFEQLDFDRVYQSCPYFRAFYDDLKATAS